MKPEDLFNSEGIKNNKELKDFVKKFHELKNVLDELSSQKFGRINPFIENIFDWKEKGEKLFPGKNVTIYDSCSMAGEVSIGENTWIGPFTALDGAAGIKIGKNCSISSKVNIVTHDSVKWALSGGKMPYDTAPIEIGDCCFIGTGAMITKGVKIGNHCLIGAGAIVTESFPDYSIIYGVPAKQVGKVILKNEEVTLEYFKKKD